MTGPRVFISYAHDDSAHTEKVRALWRLLRDNGIEAKLDRPAAEVPQDWTLWMQREYEQADFVLVVASPAYKRRAEGNEVPGRGEGVGWEARLLRAEILTRPNDWFRRILPVILPGRSTDELPSFMGGRAVTHYAVDPLTTAGAETLLRYLTGQPYEIEPPLGPIPVFAPRDDDDRGAPDTAVAPEPAPDADVAHPALGNFERQLNLRTPRELHVRHQDGPTRVTVDRSAACRSLADAMTETAGKAGTLVVHGEPSVGKSVLCLQAVDLLRESGAQVVALSLRDVQPPLPALDTAVGVPLARLFASLPAADTRLLVLDGAEAVQEGARDRLLALADAAHNAGLGVVAVARDDALDLVEDALGAVAGAAPDTTRIEPLTDTDVERLLHDIPPLARLRERRSRWLLRRVGLVGLALRGDMLAALRDGAPSEADVFDACWRGWVRRQEQYVPGGPAPDAREQALLHLAREELCPGRNPGTADATALPSLRSDGLLLPLGPGASWRSRESFSNDVVRDFATARLLLTDGFATLAAADAPRWAVRAATVACQARLAAVDGGRADGALTELLRFFGELADGHGARWADVPWEAVLSTGAAESTLRAVTDLLLQDRGRFLAQLLRVAEQRLAASGAADPILLEPLVAWLVRQHGTVRGLPGDIPEQADRIVLSWLGGLAGDTDADDDPVTREVRRDVREYLLGRDEGTDDRTYLEMLATLGPDGDERTHALLRRIAEHRPRALQPVVENPGAVLSLGTAVPRLLAELALAYYIGGKKKKKRAGNAALGAELVRDHQGGWRVGEPRSAWYYGPFWALLRLEPALGLTVVNTLLDHAATAEAERRAARRGGTPSEPVVEGLELDLLGLGPRRYAGTAQVYGWYRDAGTSPAPCTSALLAWERMADQLHAAGLPLRDTALCLLRRAHSLAAVGVVIGFLVRHLDDVTDELDDFLAVPELWEFENLRATRELTGLLVVRDDAELRGLPLRRATFRDVAALLVTRAAATGDDTAAERLRTVGTRLLEAGPKDASGRPVLEARIRAANLDAGNYSLVRAGTDVAATYAEPPELAAELDGTRRDLTRTSTMYGLQSSYCLGPTPPFVDAAPRVKPESLADDVRTAVELLHDPPSGATHQHVDAAGAVAAAVVRTTGADIPVPGIEDDQVEWAVRTVVACAAVPCDGRDLDEDTLFSMGADRSAASALPFLLLPSFTHGGRWAGRDAVEPGVVAAALSASLTASHEVRRITARALRAVWTAPCGPDQATCRHRLAWQAVEQGVRDIVMGPWDSAGRRDYVPIEGDPLTVLPTLDASDLMLHRIVPALVATVDAAASTCCVASDAAALRGVLLDAYVRTALHWEREMYTVREEETLLVADALLAATRTGPGLLTEAVVGLGGVSATAGALLRGARTAATYDTERRTRLRDVWPVLMETVLELSEEPRESRRPSHRATRALGALVPAPAPVHFDSHADRTAQDAREDWLTAGHLAPAIERWLPAAVGDADAVDDLIGLLRASPVDDQLSPGLTWVRNLAVPQGGQVVRGSYLLVEWLRSVRESGRLDGQARKHYDVIVDALAAAGNVAARELQRADE
ncbi:hypothetical protein GCM10027074_19590 [Streptomyces deserti]